MANQHEFDAQFQVLNVKLDGIKALLDQRLDSIEAKVEHHKSNTDMSFENVGNEIEKLESRLSALEHVRSQALGWIAGISLAIVGAWQMLNSWLEHFANKG